MKLRQRAHAVGQVLAAEKRRRLQQRGCPLCESAAVQAREVKATAWSGDQWLIDSGLAAGDRVIVDGLQKTGPGRVVRPVALGDSAQSAVPVTAAATTAGGKSR